jgi:hypothetical protein
MELLAMAAMVFQVVEVAIQVQVILEQVRLAMVVLV